MTRIAAALLAACIATAGNAQDFAAWPGVTDPFTMQIIPGEGSIVATVIIQNELTGDATPTTAEIQIPGLPVTVHVDHGPGGAPDRVWLTLPEGLIAVPPTIDIDEGQSGSINILLIGGLLG